MAVNTRGSAFFPLRDVTFGVIAVNMIEPSDTDRLLSEAADRMKKEAYAAGWRDALVAAARALSELGDSTAVPDKFNLANSSTTAKSSIMADGGKMPKVGTTPHAILMQVMATPGMTGGEIVDAVRNSGHTAPVPSIQTNIQRLKQRKMIVLRHGKWYAE